MLSEATQTRNKHDLKLTPGHVNRLTNEVEPPWKCEVCQKYFHRRTDARTCRADVLYDPNGNTGGECGEAVVADSDYCEKHNG